MLICAIEILNIIEIVNIINKQMITECLKSVACSTALSEEPKNLIDKTILYVRVD